MLKYMKFHPMGTDSSPLVMSATTTNATKKTTLAITFHP